MDPTATDILKIHPHSRLFDARLGDPAVPLPPLPAPVAEEPLVPPDDPPPEEPVAITPSRAREEEQARQHAELTQRLDEERARIETSLTALHRAVTDWQAAQQHTRDEWQRSAIELAVTLATRLVHDRIVAGDFPIEALIRDLIGQIDIGHVTIALHPDDLALLRQRLGDRPLTEDDANLAFTTDPTLGRGDCRVEGQGALVLAELRVQLTEARRRLLRSLGHARA